MKSIYGKQLCKIVEQKGWVLQRITGSHYISENPEV
ncbi:MAG: type II toxin-antitoxin system HicA family toxin [Nostoc sp.]